MSLAGQTALVTGAARGLGFAFSEILAAAGCNIAAFDIISEPPEELLKLRVKYGVKVEYYHVDISSRAEVRAAISRVEGRFPSIDINVNAAGIARNESFLSSSEDTVDRTFAVNFTGSYFVAQACAKSMVERVRKDGTDVTQRDPSTSGGCIVFIGSITTHIASSAQNISAYVASKSAVRGLVKPLAMELAPYGIRVNSLSPGYMMTDMMKGLQTQQPDLIKQFEKETMFGRIGDPEEVKGALLFLCARRASGWVTGQDLLVDGGASSWKHPAVWE